MHMEFPNTFQCKFSYRDHQFLFVILFCVFFCDFWAFFEWLLVVNDLIVEIL